jgi:hypothetical protein
MLESCFGQTLPRHKPARVHVVIQEAATRVGLDLGERRQVLDLGAVGIARLLWRDSPLEDWHASPGSRISDSELMRATVAVTRLVRDLLDRHVADGPGEWLLSSDVDIDVVLGVVGRAFSPGLVLPDGRVLRDLAPGQAGLDAFADYVDAVTCQWVAAAEVLGGGTVLMMVAVLGAARCRRWWLGLDWPGLVAEFIVRVKEPGRWRDPAMIAHLRRLDQPAQGADPDRLRRLLLAGPDRLDADTARYCLQAGLGFLLPRDYGGPARIRHILPRGLLDVIEPPPPGSSPVLC